MIRLNKPVKYGFFMTILIVLLLCYRYTPNEDLVVKETVDDSEPYVIVGKAKQFFPTFFGSYSNGYKNSDSLSERLKPKLAKPFSPRPGQLDSGKRGSDIWDDIGAAHNAKDLKIREEGYKLFAFNTLVSSRLSLHRKINDTRHKACRNLTYPSPKVLPTASVVICFYREDLYVLLRTIHSVIERSPREVLKEIVLINDQSDMNIVQNITDHLQNENLVQLVKLYTAPERMGLIRARIFGARKATGDVLVFLDSHVEANVQWLEPLLSRIQNDKTRVGESY